MKRNRRQHGAQRRGSQPGSVRIIAGQWRGRRLPVADVDGLRPTGDRVRETLFNWLAPYVAGSRCLDLFAGAGALGFEAGSRGAREVTLVELDRRAAAVLREAAGLLGGDGLRIVNADALAWLDGVDATFDLVFLDPPFAGDLLGPVLPKLAEVVAPRGLVYVETARDEAPLPPPGFEVVRDRSFGEVRVQLWRRSPPDESSAPA